jgi:hypothetical protein
MPKAELRCGCGAVRGVVADASPATTTRVVCYCDDCQAYAHYLGRSDLLDEHGGSDIVQVAPAALSFSQGDERIVCVRLTPKGLYRHYASCCNTPIGNSLRPGVPFVGILARDFESEPGGADALFGEPLGGIFGKFATGTPPEGSTKLNPRMLIKCAGAILSWRFSGRAWPHPFFDRATRSSNRPLTILSDAERAALRVHCGPKAA